MLGSRFEDHVAVGRAQQLHDDVGHRNPLSERAHTGYKALHDGGDTVRILPIDRIPTDIVMPLETVAVILRLDDATRLRGESL